MYNFQNYINFLISIFSIFINNSLKVTMSYFNIKYKKRITKEN